MPLKSEEIEKLIKESMPDAEISIQDLAGDNNHYSTTIKSKEFAGKSRISVTTSAKIDEMKNPDIVDYAREFTLEIFCIK